MKLDKATEEKLAAYVKETFADDLWDLRHTLSAAKHMKAIVSAEGGNERILVTAMYLHDIGYAGALQDGYSLAERIEVKAHHMERGAEKAEALLKELGYGAQEIRKISRLIRVHDALDGEHTRDEGLVIEADSLAQIDPEVGNNFGDEEYGRYVEIFRRKRAPLLRTAASKRIFAELAEKNALFKKFSDKK